MFTRLQQVSLAAVCLATSLWCLDLCADPNAQSKPTKERVLELLPQGPDMLDRRDVANYQQLLLLGTNAHPALAEILDETSDPIVISRILAVFAEAQGDKGVPIAATRKLLVKYQGKQNRDADDVKIAASTCLGRIGKPEEINSLIPLLDDGDEGVRINALRAIAKLGRASDVKRIQKFLQQRKARLTADEVAKDYSLKEAEKVIEQLTQNAKKVSPASNGAMPPGSPE